MENQIFIENENLLPTQFPTTRKLSPAQKLITRMLFQAVEDLLFAYRTTGRSADRLWNSTVVWFLSTDDSYGSFVFCCQHTGFDPHAFRATITKQYVLAERPPKQNRRDV